MPSRVSLLFVGGVEACSASTPPYVRGLIRSQPLIWTRVSFRDPDRLRSEIRRDRRYGEDAARSQTQRTILTASASGLKLHFTTRPLSIPNHGPAGEWRRLAERTL